MSNRKVKSLMLAAAILAILAVSLLAYRGIERPEYLASNVTSTQVVQGSLSSQVYQSTTAFSTSKGGTNRSYIWPSLLSTSGTEIINTYGQAVNLYGVAYGGLLYGHTNAAYSQFARDGFNVVRLPVAWSHFEPQPYTFSSDYLSLLDQNLAWASDNHLYVIVDMHQSDLSPWFGGEGFPNWAVEQYPQSEAGQQLAWHDFWMNYTLQNHLINVWVRIAQYYAGDPVIAGFDLLNEPRVVTPSENVSILNAFYERLITAVRAVDAHRMLLLEPPFDGSGSRVLEPEYLPIQNVVWSPHFYTDSFWITYDESEYSDLQAQVLEDYALYVTRFHQPILYGEFGAFQTDSSVHCLWIQDAMGLFRQYGISWVWWEYYGVYQPMDAVILAEYGCVVSTYHTLYSVA